MKTFNSHSLIKLSDTELNNLHDACVLEVVRRGKVKAQRKEWIEARLNSFRYFSGKYMQVGEAVVVAVRRSGNLSMGKATPINGDVFELNTGIAVAYAKAVGEIIPDFI